MSISINKLMNLASSPDMLKTDSKKKSFGSKELPDKLETRKSEGVQDLSASQYYASVKGNRMPKNVANILQLGTPSGANAIRGNKTVPVPLFSEPDGAIDPNRIRSITDPNSAQPYTFEGAYGLEGGVKFSIPKSTKTSNNSIGLLRQAQMSYQNRQQILAPRQPQIQTDTGILQEGGTTSPPPYQDTNSTPYKDDNQDSELNESYN